MTRVPFERDSSDFVARCWLSSTSSDLCRSCSTLCVSLPGSSIVKGFHETMFSIKSFRLCPCSVCVLHLILVQISPALGLDPNFGRVTSLCCTTCTHSLPDPFFVVGHLTDICLSVSRFCVSANDIPFTDSHLVQILAFHISYMIACHTLLSNLPTVIGSHVTFCLSHSLYYLIVGFSLTLTPEGRDTKAIPTFLSI